MTNDKTKTYDLEERTAQFAEAVISLCRQWPKSSVSQPILDQLIRSGTSIGANYYEANGASSKKDFKNKIHMCKKESKETQYWLRLLLKTNDNDLMGNACRALWQEAKELTLIFSKIASSTK